MPVDPEVPVQEAVDADVSPVYFLPNCDLELARNNLDEVLQHISMDLSKNEADKPLVVLSSRRQITSLTAISGYPQFCVSMCRHFNLLKNDRVTLLSPMDQLIAIQLCLAEKNKQESGDFDVEASVVMQASKDITNSKLLSHYDITSCTEESGICELYQKFLEDCNAIDTCDAFCRLREECRKNDTFHKQIVNQPFVVLDRPKSAVDRQVLEFLCEGKTVKTVTVEIPLDGEDGVTVTIENSCIATLLEDQPTMSTMKKPPSVTEAYVRIVYLSYLELLVNSRSELAMSRVFNVPERELTHSAFTDLKHEAQEKKMTMYQSATSYIMRIRLGGKGYAPDPNHPLGPHVKGIGEFVSLMHRMETVLEEDPDIRSACRRVVNILKKEMLKCRDSRIRNTSVESVAEHLHQQIATIIDDLDKKIVNTPGKAPSNGGSLTSRRARKALRHLLDKLATVDDDLSSLDHLTDIYSSQRTPLRFPSIMSQFRSPAEELEVTSPSSRFNKSLSQRVLHNSLRKSTPTYAKRYKSSCDWAEPVHHVELQKDEDIFSSSQVYIIPSKTIVHAGSKFSLGEARKVLDAMLEKDEGSTDVPSHRLSDVTNTDCTTSEADDTSKPVHKEKPDTKKPKPVKVTAKPAGQDGKQSKKRTLLEEGTQSSQPEKKKKADQSKSCRRKLLPQVKGQQSLTKFFR